MDWRESMLARYHDIRTPYVCISCLKLTVRTEPAPPDLKLGANSKRKFYEVGVNFLHKKNCSFLWIAIRFFWFALRDQLNVITNPLALARLSRRFRPDKRVERRSALIYSGKNSHQKMWRTRRRKPTSQPAFG